MKAKRLFIDAKSKGFVGGDAVILPPVKRPSVLDGSATLREALYRDGLCVGVSSRERYVSPGEDLDPVLRSHLNRS